MSEANTTPLPADPQELLTSALQLHRTGRSGWSGSLTTHERITVQRKQRDDLTHADSLVRYRGLRLARSRSRAAGCCPSTGVHPGRLLEGAILWPVPTLAGSFLARYRWLFTPALRIRSTLWTLHFQTMQTVAAERCEVVDRRRSRGRALRVRPRSMSGVSATVNTARAPCSRLSAAALAARATVAVRRHTVAVPWALPMA